MPYERPIPGKELNNLRFQKYSRAQSISDGSYESKYLRKDVSESFDIAELYHENTKLTKEILHHLEETSRDISEVLGGIEDRIEPDFPDNPTIKLPAPGDLSVDLDRVLTTRRSVGGFESKPLELDTLSTVLYYSAGLPRIESSHRMYPSPGMLYPSELYLFVFDILNCPSGIYFYNHRNHELRQILELGTDELFKRFKNAVHSDGIEPDLGNAKLVFVTAADFWRVKFKYGPRGYRYTLQESGHIMQNLLLTLTAAGLGGRPLAAFGDDSMNDLLEIDGLNNATTYMLCAGHPERDGDE